jgi:hypothetical protein
VRAAVGASDRQHLTAGHCGFAGSNSWYHAGYSGSIAYGGETASWYIGSHIDAMRVNIPNTQVSASIYGTARSVSGVRRPILGEIICASLGKSNTVPCGTVTSPNSGWVSSTCNCIVNGADSSLTTIGGDSGSPMYSAVGAVDAVALGISDTSIGQFAIVYDVLQLAGDTIYQ